MTLTIKTKLKTSSQLKYLGFLLMLLLVFFWRVKIFKMRQHIFQSWFILPFLFLSVSCRISFSVGTDTLSAGQNISGTSTLTSKGRTFQLSFFNPGKSNKVYLGISYVNLEGQMPVWVANRDKPLDSSPYNILKLSEDGNLVLLNALSKTTFWSTNLKSSSTSNFTEAVLLDEGNFVLRKSSEPSIIYWQSFDHPTDTWLPGAKLGINKLTGKTQLLTSWKNSEDPAPGRFSFGIDLKGSNRYFLQWNMSRRYWSTGASILTVILNFSFVLNETENYSIYSLRDSFMLARLVISPSGQIEQPWKPGLKFWGLNYYWAQPRNLSEVFAFCGANGIGIFNETSSTNCTCLQGFKQNSTEETQLDDWSGGCVRNTPLKCQNNNSNGKNDGFLKISNLILPVNSKAYPAKNAKRCESACRNSCSCTAYAYNGSGCSIWEGALLNLQLSNDNKSKQDLYLKLAASELRGNRKKLWVIIASLVPLAVLISGFFLWYLRRRKLSQNGVEYSNEDVLLYDFDGSFGATDHETNGSSRGKKDADLPFFSFASVSAATGGFSSANKLGEGGFGPVYRGRLLRGQEIAVKRLSRRSGQGAEEFRNETVLIAKLQHRNLVRLLGCCIEQDEKILIYEYMPNKSLDFLLFEATNKQEMLDWRTRIHIIEGISQGLLYLHQYSRLRIIHRDLKASNVLLDGEMNPKISDFGMARIFGGNELQANTNRIVGTYGYMAPEYAMEGLFSIKSDVFSFGVLLLEILSGKRNTGFYRSNSLNLLGHAWDLWNADRGSDLLDPVVDCPSTLMLLRYINIGLLCVQENPTDRPTMSNVVTMLSNELAPLPKPKQPAFSTSRAMVVDANSSQSSGGTCSVNGVTISTLQGR